MDYANIRSEKIERVGLITLDRPAALNALNDALADELWHALDGFEADDGIGVVVITGSEKAFAAGADITAIADYGYMDAYKGDYITRNWERVKTCRKPVIAAVAGYALGGGCELAMMCDMIFAADTAKFGQPEIKLGVRPGAGGTQRLPRAIGKAEAMDMCLTARMTNAVEAERAGLVARVFPADTLLDETLAVARGIAGISLPMVMMVKESGNRAYQSSLQEGLLFEVAHFTSPSPWPTRRKAWRHSSTSARPTFGTNDRAAVRHESCSPGHPRSRLPTQRTDRGRTIRIGAEHCFQSNFLI